MIMLNLLKRAPPLLSLLMRLYGNPLSKKWDFPSLSGPFEKRSLTMVGIQLLSSARSYYHKTETHNKSQAENAYLKDWLITND